MTWFVLHFVQYNVLEERSERKGDIAFIPRFVGTFNLEYSYSVPDHELFGYVYALELLQLISWRSTD